MTKHELIDGTLTREADGIMARCKCGWTSGGHFSSAAASMAFGEHQERAIKLGATGEFPQGKVHESDEGELQFAIGIKDGKVMVRFDTPVAWFGMSAEMAVDFAETLIDKARIVAHDAGRPLTITLGGRK